MNPVRFVRGSYLHSLCGDRYVILLGSRFPYHFTLYRVVIVFYLYHLKHQEQSEVSPLQVSLFLEGGLQNIRAERKVEATWSGPLT